jgi:hypothetical protein
LNVAGYSAGSLFTRDALADIARESAGIPRMINILCYNSLALGCAREQKCIDVGIVRQAATDLALEQGAGDAKQLTARHCASSRGEVRHSNQNDEILKADAPIAGCAVTERTNDYPSTSKIWTRFSMLAKGSLALAVLLIIIPIGTRPKLSQPAGPTSLKVPIEWTADSSSTISGGKVSAADDTRSDHAPILTGIRYWSELTTTRVVIDLDERVKYDAYRLAAPDRVYLDLHGSKLSSVLFGRSFKIKDTLLRKIRVAEHAQDMTRVTLETSKPCDYSIAVITNPTRLSITLWSTGRHTTEASSSNGLSALVSN